MQVFSTELTNPGSLKSGEYLEERMLLQAGKMIGSDREGVISVCRDWILRRDGPYTMFADDRARGDDRTLKQTKNFNPQKHQFRPST